MYLRIHDLLKEFLRAISFLVFLLARKLFPDVMLSKYTLDCAHTYFEYRMQEMRKINLNRKSHTTDYFTKILALYIKVRLIVRLA